MAFPIKWEQCSDFLTSTGKNIVLTIYIHNLAHLINQLPKPKSSKDSSRCYTIQIRCTEVKQLFRENRKGRNSRVHSTATKAASSWQVRIQEWQFFKFSSTVLLSETAFETDVVVVVVFFFRGTRTTDSVMSPSYPLPRNATLPQRLSHIQIRSAASYSHIATTQNRNHQ